MEIVLHFEAIMQYNQYNVIFSYLLHLLKSPVPISIQSDAQNFYMFLII
jgi:hypothetical protein